MFHRTLSHAALLSVSLVASAHAGHGDILLHLPPGADRFATGAFDVDADQILAVDQRVFESAFGELGAGATDEPGLVAIAGSLPTSMLIGFDIADAVRIWNGADFDTVSPSTITCERLAAFATSPTTAGQTTPGFWLDTTGATGGIHVHIDFYLDAPITPGVYLLMLQLRTSHPTIANPEPLYIVFDNDNPAGEAEVDAAVDYVNNLIAPPACAGDVNGDGFTNAADFTILAGNFGSNVPPNTGGDLNGDGIVNAADFVILAGDFGC